MSDRIHLIVLQPTSLCNLNCEYCYVPGRRDASIVADEVLVATIDQAIHSTLVRKRIEILFHAGEPLTVGVDFYRKAAELVESRNDRGVTVIKSIQTNATLINEEWCDLFRRHDYRIGVSIDGPAFIHDRHRVNWSGKGSFAAAMRGITKLKQHEISFGAICVLSRDSLAHPDEIFSFFKDNGFPSVGFNIEEIENANKTSSMFASRTSDTQAIRDEFQRFMSRFFDLWEANGRAIRVREFFETALFMQRKRDNNRLRRIPDETRDMGIVTVRRNGDMSVYA